jgi:glucose-6-phosphate dehydrogenase assembly protein OpcA
MTELQNRPGGETFPAFLFCARMSVWRTSMTNNDEPERCTEVQEIRRALMEGEESGEPEEFDFDAFIARKLAQFEK